MKIIFTKLLLLLSIANLWGQTFFEVEGKKVQLAEITKSYHFGYKFKDSSNLFLIDSVLTFYNTQKTIVKEIRYSSFPKENYTIITYSRSNGEDSISKKFIGKKFINTYIHALNKKIVCFDNLTHLINNDDCYNNSTKDSTSSEGKITIQTCFHGDILCNNLIEHRSLIYFDKQNRKMIEVHNLDSIIYKYDNNDSLISKLFYNSEIADGYEELLKTKHVNSQCDSEYVYTFLKTDFHDVKNDILKLLIEHKSYLINYDCKECFLNFISPNSQIILNIHRQQKNSLHGEERIYFATTQKF